MTKRKRNLFIELMNGINAMRLHRKERRNIGREVLHGLRELKKDEQERMVNAPGGIVRKDRTQGPK